MFSVDLEKLTPIMRSLISGYRRNTGEASRSAWSRVSVPAAYYRGCGKK
jgi:hypothetical protein